MPNLQKVIKVTKQQYDILAAGGTVGSYTGLDDNFIYLVEDTNEYLPTTGGTIINNNTVQFDDANHDLKFALNDCEGYNEIIGKPSDVYMPLFADETYALVYSQNNDYYTDFTFATKRLKVYDADDTENSIWFDAETHEINHTSGSEQYFAQLPAATGVIALTSDLNNRVDKSFLGANEFSSSLTYNVGDKATHEGKLYKCTTTISVAGAWDANDWDELTIEDYVVEANPGSTTATLSSIKIGNTSYAISGGGGGSATNVKINGTSITSGGEANILTNTAYNETTNKIATMSDMPGAATTSAAGLMSAADKTKLDGVATGAQVNTIETVKVNGTALTPDANKAVNIVSIEVVDASEIDDDVKAKFITNPASIVLEDSAGHYYHHGKSFYNNGGLNSSFFICAYTEDDASEASLRVIEVNWTIKESGSSYYVYDVWGPQNIALLGAYGSGTRKILSNSSGAQSDLDLGDLQVSSDALKETIPSASFIWNSTNNRFEQGSVTNFTGPAILVGDDLGEVLADVRTSIRYYNNGGLEEYIDISSEEIDINGLLVKGTLNSYLGYTQINNNVTQLSYDRIYNISLSAARTFTLETPPNGCNPEYRAIITNTNSSSAITITLPSGTIIKTNDPDIHITSNYFQLPKNTTIELNIQNGHAIVYNWAA